MGFLTFIIIKIFYLSKWCVTEIVVMCQNNINILFPLTALFFQKVLAFDIPIPYFKGTIKKRLGNVYKYTITSPEKKQNCIKLLTHCQFSSSKKTMDLSFLETLVRLANCVFLIARIIANDMNCQADIANMFVLTT